MSKIYTAQIHHRGEWWFGWIREIPGINCQERSREELLDTLKITLLEAFEFEVEEAATQIEGEYEVVRIAV